MLVFDLYTIGAKLYEIRRRKGLTQAEVAEKAELSDRTYADIERGHVNMRVETLLKICSALNITPNNILVTDDNIEITEQTLIDILKDRSNNEKETALRLLNVYVNSLK
ncbi:MAG: helix-turn-helix transcriptional regulator [Ruminococcaceae bacterium]|nr:helix-turn-helix transcriptional regulator [Oscillospiraceae bacterium]